MRTTDLVLVDAGGSNLASVQAAFARLGITAPVVSDWERIQQATHVVLPGVGAAASAMLRLSSFDLVNKIPLLKQPVLGVCVGVQLLFARSEEANTACLSIIDAPVQRLANAPGIRIPHMGWNRVELLNDHHPLCKGLADQFAYFVHSFAAPVGAYTLAHCTHGSRFSAIVARDNFMGAQFHPEPGRRRTAFEEFFGDALMQLYPAIDLRSGQVVRLIQGDFAQQTTYQTDPVALAQQYEAAGADWLHLVDLDGAKGDNAGSLENLHIVEKIAACTRLKIQTGGGVRTEQDLRERYGAGAARVVIGSVAVHQPLLAIAWLSQFGAQRLTLALDARADAAGVYRVHTAGWQQAAQSELFECVQRFETAGFVHALVTDIALDGMLAGPNIALYVKLKSMLKTLHVQASGGVSALSDLHALAANDIAGVIIGKALLEGRFSFADALQAVST
jgi:phosphoribosylformimino-5-aminoimidazole carboxamide ribotide isomerase